MTLMWTLFDELEEMTRRSNVGTLFAPVEPGSRMARDDIRTQPYRVSHCIQSLLNNAIEHATSLAALVRTAGLMPGGPPFTLSRAAVESAATGYWLLEPAEQKERIRRHLIHQSQDRFDLETVSRMTADRTGEPIPTEVQDRKAYITDVREAHSLPTLPRQLKASEVIKEVDKVISSTTHFELYWRTASGFGHGRPWARMHVLIKSEVMRISDDIARVQFSTNPGRVLWCVAAAHELIDRTLNLYYAACRAPSS